MQKVNHTELKDHYGKKYFATKEPAAPFTQIEFDLFIHEKNLFKDYENNGFLALLLKDELSISLF